MASPSYNNYEPMSRCYHTSALVANKVVAYSGRTREYYSKQSRERLASIVEVYDPYSEQWEAKQCWGETPAPGLCGAASTSCKGYLFQYGGRDGDGKYVHSLHRLNAKTYQWNNLPGKGTSPMPKWGTAMALCGDDLALAGGYGIPHGPTKSGSSFVKNTHFSDGRGWTNEFHIYHVNEGTHTTTICSIPLVSLLFVV